MLKSPYLTAETLRFLIDLFPTLFSQDQKISATDAMQVIRGHTVQNIKKGVSNLSLEVQEVSGFSFKYFYTRQNLTFAHQPQLEEIYPGLKSQHSPYYSSFYSSGQSAISSLFLALAQDFQNFSLYSPVKVYFETPLALQLINQGSSTKGETFFLIDSTRIEPQHLSLISENFSKYKFAMIDTSLWAWDEPVLQSLIDTLEGKIDLFLMRSHLKLDCLGGEYSTLGSIVYISSDETSIQARESLIKNLTTVSSSLGSYPSLDQIYPFYKNKTFHELTFKRIKKIKESLKRILPRLLPFFNDKYLDLEIPYHGLFIIFHLKTKEADLRKQILKLIRLEDGPVALVDSYGFDFPSVLVAELTHERGTNLVRMNGYTMEKEYDEQIIETYKNIIQASIRFALPH